MQQYDLRAWDCEIWLVAWFSRLAQFGGSVDAEACLEAWLRNFLLGVSFWADLPKLKPKRSV